jgi:hypothetical protein
MVHGALQGSCNRGPSLRAAASLLVHGMMSTLMRRKGVDFLMCRGTGEARGVVARATACGVMLIVEGQSSKLHLARIQAWEVLNDCMHHCSAAQRPYLQENLAQVVPTRGSNTAFDNPGILWQAVKP